MPSNGHVAVGAVLEIRTRAEGMEDGEVGAVAVDAEQDPAVGATADRRGAIKLTVRAFDQCDWTAAIWVVVVRPGLKVIQHGEFALRGIREDRAAQWVRVAFLVHLG